MAVALSLLPGGWQVGWNKEWGMSDLRRLGTGNVGRQGESDWLGREIRGSMS